ncbi:MAG: flavin prenyltransferase UbiX [Coriobacteriia bacterium]
MSSYVVVITGASGSVYGMRAVEQLLSAGHSVALVVTPTGAEVMAYELGFRLPTTGAREAVLRFLEMGPDVALRVAADGDLFDAAASGSSPVDGVVVIPASMGFIGSVAAGLASDLAERAADVALKERRPLVLVPRETPLNLIHLKNLTRLAEAGAVIAPAMPAFYHRPETLDDQVNFVVGKILDVLGVNHDLYQRWRE